MTHGFQQQDTMVGFSTLRSAASPQHGQKAAPKPARTPAPRSHPPRPPH